MKNTQAKFSYLHIIQFQKILWVILTGSIGFGLADYLGATVNWVNVLLGGFLAVFLLLMQDFLAAYYDHPISLNTSLLKSDPMYDALGNLDRQTLLVISLTSLTAGALATVLLMIRQALNLSAMLVLGIAFVVSFLTVAPPVQLNKRGYGEVAEAIVICNLIPAIMFLLCIPDIHVLLLMLTLPITLLYLAFRIVFELETYSFDRVQRHLTLVIRLDWQKAMTLHNYLVLLSFFFIGLFALFGQPWSLTWPMLLPLLIGIYQVAQMFGIMSGRSPRWKLLKLTAGASFAIMIYLISFTLWIS